MTGIYIHWPFCVSKCPYCDFNSHVRRSIDEDQFCDAIIQELTYYRSNYSFDTITSVFFGGGTPSLMHPKTVHRIIDSIHRLFTINSQIEVTLEANPNSSEAQKFQDLKASGINRLSLGVQSFDQETLRYLGRGHSVDEAKTALSHAYQTFDRVSFDLIYAHEHQTLESWKQELRQALSYQPTHLSLYQLTIEPNTAFEVLHQKGKIRIPDADKAYDLYTTTQEMLAQHGLSFYEISNAAQTGYECRHNLTYWRYRPYIGVGPGAHGRLHTKHEIIATEHIKSPLKWLQAVEKQAIGQEQSLVLTLKERVEENLFMSLRLLEPLLITPIMENFLRLKRLSELNEFIVYQPERNTLQMTVRGRLVLHAILNEIL